MTDSETIKALLNPSVNELDSQARTVIELRFGLRGLRDMRATDLTLEEVSGVLGISVGSARRHYHRGKERLRQSLPRAEGA